MMREAEDNTEATADTHCVTQTLGAGRPELRSGRRGRQGKRRTAEALHSLPPSQALGLLPLIVGLFI